jgi:DnaK suppressor protein
LVPSAIVTRSLDAVVVGKPAMAMAAKEETMSPASKATAAKKKVNPSRLLATTKTAAKRIAPASKKAAPAAKKAAMTKKSVPVTKMAAPAGKNLAPSAKKAAPGKAVPAKALPSKVASTKVASNRAATTGSTKTASNKAAPAKAGSSRAASTKVAPPAKKALATKKVEAKKASPTVKKAAPAGKAAVAAEVSPRPLKTLGVKPKPLAPVKPKTGPYAKEGKFLEEQTELLVIERDIYQEQATSLRAEADSLALEREPGDVQFDEESGEGGTVTVDRERNLALSGQAALAVEEIDLAIERVVDKTYGYCERCYQPIPKPRLRALPYARLCVACKSGGLSRR